MTKKARINVSECPSDLSLILASINLLPDDLDKFEAELIELNKSFFDPHKFWELVPIELEGQIKRRGFPFNFPNLYFQLCRWVEEKRILRDIILAFQDWEAGYNRQGQRIFPRQWGLESADAAYDNQLVLMPQYKLTTPLSAFNFRDDTSVALLSFRVLEILTRDRLPIKRIRECRVCHKIFWAKRKESPTCSLKCLTTDNARRTRIKNRTREYDQMAEKLRKLEARNPNGLIPAHLKRMEKLEAKIHANARKYGLTQFTNSLFRSSVID